MWNETRTDAIVGVTANLVTINGYQGAEVHAYLARPVDDRARPGGPYGGIVLVHHMPGWDELYREIARRFAEHGYVVICPNLYEGFGHGTPSDVAAKARSEGGVSDDSVLADCEASLKYLKTEADCNGKIGIIGTCSGGRHSYLTACRVQGFSALVNCWGGGVVASTDRLTQQQPVSPHDYTPNLSCPVLGIFGNEDANPSPEQVGQLEDKLKEHGKTYEFHRYDGAGHGFWYYDRANYRHKQAMDSWNRTLSFFAKYLG